MVKEILTVLLVLAAAIWGYTLLHNSDDQRASVIESQL